MPQPGTAKLVIQMADGSTQEHELGEQAVSIGRDPGCDIRIQSQYVSRRHALISPFDGRFVIQDERSTNGLQINGRLVREPHPLAHGDRVVLGDVSLTYEEADDEASTTALYQPIQPAVWKQPSGPTDQPAWQKSGTSRVARPAGLCTIMFTDLVDSTRQVTRLGDVAGQQWVRRHAEIVRDQFKRYEGFEDKWTGDGFLVTFASARQAVHCAVGIQRALRDYNRANPDAPMHVRAGLNTGEVLREDDELFGNAVILASRVMARANADEILLSELMYRLVQSAREFVIVERGVFLLKGIPQRQRLYEVKWEEEPAGTAPT